MSTIIQIGAGLGGTLASIFLGRAGHDVRGFELRPDPRRGPLVGGRSINLALSARGLGALEKAGLLDRVLALAVPMRGRMIHDLRGHTAFQPYGTERGHANHSVSRADLNVLLLEAAEREKNVRFAFGRRCVDIDPDAPSATFAPAEGTGPDGGAGGRMDAPGDTVRGDVVLGTDGAWSVVRRRLQRLDRFDYDQSFLSHGYKELTIPPGPKGSFLLEREALHIWPRGGFMMIALPNRDGSFTCTLFWPHAGPNSFGALADGSAVTRFFERHFPDALPLFPDLPEQYVTNPVGSMVTIRCRPWHVRGKAALLGDAAHAVVPFHGQGANCAFEDAVVLDECVRAHAPDWETVFDLFESRRKEHTDALARLSVDNFVEMRDHTASRLFRLRKGLEKGLYRLLPGLFMPLYMMISFTRIPYAETVRRARRQALTLQALAAGIGAAAVVAVAWYWRRR
ncbi:MAG TPA: NAD(P)/FAD-dependent oxidoreductase [Candidatus Polarisedimenticolia bacterium]|nr:NAD(P)/FAD-dependent oxidoreductase [Candidatus Polarisedimenticolia bacterium]